MKLPSLRATLPVSHLSEAWLDVVRGGHVTSVFDADGRRIRFGVRTAAATSDDVEWYAEDLTTGRALHPEIMDDDLGHGFRKVFNGFRALRPNAAKLLDPGPQKDIPDTPRQCPFRCQDAADPFGIWNRPTLVLESTEADRAWSFIPNAAPFTLNGHVVVVPTDQKESAYDHVPQTLDENAVRDFLHLASRAPGWFWWFNSLHAGGTVAHRHFQAIKRDNLPLPLELAGTRSEGPFQVLRDYPADALVFDFVEDSDAAAAGLWRAVQKFQALRRPLNMLALAGRAFLFVRNPEHEIVEEFRSGVIASCELAGCFITSDVNTFRDLNLTNVASAFGKTTLSAEGILQTLR